MIAIAIKQDLWALSIRFRFSSGSFSRVTLYVFAV
jgi:hypothetical protein